MRYLLVIIFSIAIMSCSSKQTIANDYFRKAENRTELSVLCNLTFPPSIIKIPGDTIVLKERTDVIVKDNKDKIDVEVECPPSEVQKTYTKTIEYIRKDSIITKWRDRLVTDTLKIDDPSKRELLNNQINELSADNYKLQKDKELADNKSKKDGKTIFYLWLAVGVLIAVPIIYKLIKSKIL